MTSSKRTFCSKCGVSLASPTAACPYCSPNDAGISRQGGTESSQGGDAAPTPAPSPPDVSRIRLKTLVIHTLIVIFTIVATAFSSSDFFTYFNPMYFVTHVAAPAYIGYRVSKAPLDSGVFAISWITSFVVAFLLYAFIVSCKGSGQCAVYLFLAGIVFTFSAFLCVFTKKEP